jgi:hypothetical protein
MKQQIQKFIQTKKTNFKKFIQTKLRKFLQTEYRTSEEIQKDTMNVYLNRLKQICPIRDGTPLYSDDYLSTFVGEINYIISQQNGKSYFKDSKSNTWFCDDGVKLTDKELKDELK